MEQEKQEQERSIRERWACTANVALVAIAFAMEENQHFRQLMQNEDDETNRKAVQVTLDSTGDNVKDTLVLQLGAKKRVKKMLDPLRSMQSKRHLDLKTAAHATAELVLLSELSTHKHKHT